MSASMESWGWAVHTGVCAEGAQRDVVCRCSSGAAGEAKESCQEGRLPQGIRVAPACKAPAAAREMLERRLGWEGPVLEHGRGFVSVLGEQEQLPAWLQPGMELPLPCSRNAA